MTEIQVVGRGAGGKAEPKTVEMRALDVNFSGRREKLVFLHDVTERKRASKLAVRMACILKHSWNEIYIFDAHTLCFIDVSAGGLRNTGYSLRELADMTPPDIEPMFTRQQFEALLQPLRENAQEEICLQTDQQRKNGTTYPVEIRLQLSNEPDDPVFIALVQDVSERRRYIERLEHNALYDEATNLPNRALLFDRLGQALRKAKEEETNLAVVVMELPHLTDMRHLLGHKEVDDLLGELARRLRRSVREPAIVARLYDKVFVAVLMDMPPEAVQACARKIQADVQQPVRRGGSLLEMEANFGIAFFPQHGEDADALIKRAEIAMRATRLDGSGVSVYRAEPNPLGARWLRLHAELRRALEKRTLMAHYQPKVSLKTRRIMGVEALARWRHPEAGMISPTVFIPIVERSGLIRPFTHWMLETAASQLQAWRAAGIDMSVAVNLSTRNLLDPSLPDFVAGLGERYGMPLERLYLEITESALMEPGERALDVVKALHELGAVLSVDDFGTGYSCLAYLKTLPLDELKIDRSFVSGLLTNNGDGVIVRALIELAHNFGLATVAEGVEDGETLARLEELGCDRVQGFYCGRPSSSAELAHWLRESPYGLQSTCGSIWPDQKKRFPITGSLTL